MNKELSDTERIKLEILTCNTKMDSFKELLEEKFINIHTRLDEIREDIKPIKDLPCNGHFERMKGLGKSLDRVWLFYGIIIAGGFTIVGVILKVLLARAAQ